MNLEKITKGHIRQLYKPVDDQAHKGTQGHALIIGGSYGKMGAATLSARAALHSGAGLVTALIPNCGYNILQTAVPEVMVLTDENEKHISNIQFDQNPDAIGIGPGLGQEQSTARALHKFLTHTKIPLVLDADALNLIAKNPSWLGLLPAGTILTPHPKELERLMGAVGSPERVLDKAIEFSKRHGVIIVKKGAPTQVIDGETVYQNTTGNQALATAGSGDVLTGIITGLLAQSYSPVHAAQLGVYLHGLTADLALPHTGHESFVASNIIAFLGKSFLTLKGSLSQIGFK